MSEAPAPSSAPSSPAAAPVAESLPPEAPPTPVGPGTPSGAAPAAADDPAAEPTPLLPAAGAVAPRAGAVEVGGVGGVGGGLPMEPPEDDSDDGLTMEPPVDDSCLAQLLALDVPEVRARRALLACAASLGAFAAPSVELAFEWLLEHGEVWPTHARPAPILIQCAT